MERLNAILQVIGFVLGLSTPPVEDGFIDFATWRQPELRNHYLGESAPQAVPADRLLAVARETILAEPRVTERRADAARRQLVFVQLTPTLKFPDTIWAQATERDGRARLILYSRSNLGTLDFGANEARVRDWLAKIEARVPKS